MAERMAQVLDLAPDAQQRWMRFARHSSAHDLDSPPEEGAALRPALAPLPVYLTPMIGRERELAELVQLLAAPSTRLVTVLGPGGIGKTRLAVEVGRASTGVPDGVAFVSLASLAAPEASVPAIADAFGYTFTGVGNLFVQLLQFLRDKRALLILDNLEHLLGSDGATLQMLTQLLAHAPQLQILVTSRERLRLTGEWVFSVEGLSVPPQAGAVAAEPYAALTLFVEHAQRIRHGFCLTSENIAAVATICRLVDGLPLGIELAAAWMGMLSAAEIGQELASNLDAGHLVVGTLPARHHSLSSVVEHSWRLVSPAAQQALARLSVFWGGFTRAAALAVADADLAMLASLVDKSLIRRKTDGRYDLHEIIRQYAAARLSEQRAMADATRDAHGQYYLQFVAEREQRLKSAEQAQMSTELSLDIDNIRAAWQRGVAQGWRSALERAAEPLQWFYEFRSWYQEGATLFAQAVARLRTVSPAADPTAHTSTLGRLLGHQGFLLSRLGAVEQARALLAESAQRLAHGQDQTGLARTLWYQGQALYFLGDYATAWQLLAQSLPIAAVGDPDFALPVALTWASVVAHARRDYAEAERLFRAGLASWRRVGSPRGTLWCVTYCSATLMELGKYAELEPLLHESLQLGQATGDHGGMAMALHRLGVGALRQGHREDAITFLNEAVALRRTLGTLEIAQTLNDLAAAYDQMGARADAERIYREAFASALTMDLLPEALEALTQIARHAAQAGRPAAALELVARVLSDPVTRSETHQQAAQLRTTIVASFTADQVAAIEERARGTPMGALLARAHGA